MKPMTVSYAAGFYGITFESFIAELSKLRVRNAQLIPDQHPNLFSDFSRDRIARITAAAAQADICLSMHNIFYDINPLSLVPSVVDFAVETTQRVAELAAMLGCKTMTLHPGYIYPGWAGDPRQRARFEGELQKKVVRLVSVVRAAGLECRFENGSYYLSSLTSPSKSAFHYGIQPEEMQRIVGATEGVSVCLDLGKVTASGLTFASFVRPLGAHIREAQVSSVKSIHDFIAALDDCGLDWTAVDYVYEGGDLLAFMDKLSNDEKLSRSGPQIG